MATVLPDTFFLPAARTPPGILDRQRRMLSADPVVTALLDGFPEPAAIINGERQIICANRKLQQFAGRQEAQIVGLRVGEAMGCQHGRGLPNGCGTTPACALCGAAKSMAATQGRGESASEECRMTLLRDVGHESLDLRVWTRPFPYGGEQFTIFTMRDTSDEQRRRVLERMFFHDVLNAAGGLRDILRLWPKLDPEEMAELSGRLAPLAAQVVEEIESQRDLAAAERGELHVTREAVRIADLLGQLETLYRNHTAADGKHLVAVACEEPAVVNSDGALLRRVLGNLLKNALEASDRGQQVTVRYEGGHSPRFLVHNEGVMTEAVRLQVFQRSFSTKGGKGRGIGTYSARLLTERYLRGRLSFSSTGGEGTTFVVELPAC